MYIPLGAVTGADTAREAALISTEAGNEQVNETTQFSMRSLTVLHYGP